MGEVLKQIVDKISSYNIFNNLYPGIVFCYLLKFLFQTNILSDNWFENIVVFYFLGMVLSRVGSIVVEPLMKKFFVKFAPYKDYIKASEANPLIVTLSETNNTYRTLLSCVTCLFVYKICDTVNNVFVEKNCTFFQDNAGWLILILQVLLFAISYVKQTNYIRKRVEFVLKSMDKSE